MRVMFNNTDIGLEAFYNPSDNQVQAVWPENIPSRRARQLASTIKEINNTVNFLANIISFWSEEIHR
jgi:hypothetical protein